MRDDLENVDVEALTPEEKTEFIGKLENNYRTLIRQLVNGKESDLATILSIVLHLKAKTPELFNSLLATGYVLWNVFLILESASVKEAKVEEPILFIDNDEKIIH